jgi:lipoprotein-releasing system permease protein
MYRFCLFMAYKYLASKKSERGISSMIIMSWITIMISSSILILIGGIMNGFEYETIASLQGLHAQITIQAQHDALDVSVLTPFLNTHIPEIKAWAPLTMRYGVLYENEFSAKPAIVSIVFIDPLREVAVSALQAYVLNKQPLQDTLTSDTIIVGAALAEHLQLTINDTVNVLVADTDMHPENGFSYEKVKVKVGGILKTGIDDIDMRTIFCSYDLYTEIYSQSTVDQLSVKLHEKVNEEKIIEKIRVLTGLTVSSWQENYPALLDALKLEKRVAFLITFLIVLMAMISMIALLYMFVESKKADIALLLILGSSLRAIRTIFMIIGLLLVSSAALSGIIIALISGYAINRFALFPLPDAYFISHITVLFDPLTVLFWYVGIVMLGFFATLIPLQLISNYSISNIIRFER